MSKDQKCEHINISPKDVPAHISKMIEDGRYIKQIIKAQVGFIILHEEQGE